MGHGCPDGFKNLRNGLTEKGTGLALNIEETFELQKDKLLSFTYNVCLAGFHAETVDVSVLH
jgi:hypothetical protein